MIDKYKISEVLDLETGKRDNRYDYRIGREVYIETDTVKVGTGIVAYYMDGRVLHTTKISEVQIDDKGDIWITTFNRKYNFVKIKK